MVISFFKESKSIPDIIKNLNLVNLATEFSNNISFFPEVINSLHKLFNTEISNIHFHQRRNYCSKVIAYMIFGAELY